MNKTRYKTSTICEWAVSFKEEESIDDLPNLPLLTSLSGPLHIYVCGGETHGLLHMVVYSNNKDPQPNGGWSVSSFFQGGLREVSRGSL